MTAHIIPFTVTEKDALVADGWVRAPFATDVALKDLFPGLDLTGNTVFGIFSIGSAYKGDDNIVPVGHSSSQNYRITNDSGYLLPAELGYRYEWTDDPDNPIEVDVHRYRRISSYWFCWLPDETGVYKWYGWQPLYIPLSTQRTKDLLYPPYLDAFIGGGQISVIDWSQGPVQGTLSQFGFFPLTGFLTTENLGVLNSSIFHCYDNEPSGDYVDYDTYYSVWTQGVGFTGGGIPPNFYGNSPESPDPPNPTINPEIKQEDSRYYSFSYNPTADSNLIVLHNDKVIVPVSPTDRTGLITIYIPTSLYIGDPIADPPDIIEVFPWNSDSGLSSPAEVTPVSPDQLIVIGSGGISFGGAATIISVVDPSGIYTLVVGKRHDTLYDRTGATSRDVMIPEPYAITGFIDGNA